MELKTKRLILRPHHKKDVNDIVENINNLNVTKWLSTVPYPYTRKDASEWVTRSIKKWKEKNKKDYSFVIELKTEKKVIGCLGIHDVDKYLGTAEVGYWIGEKYWKKGYGSEALRVIIDFCFKKLKLKRLEAKVFVGNPSSGKLLEKFGFKKEGLKRRSVRSKADGKIKDEYIYGLLKSEYKK